MGSSLALNRAVLGAQAPAALPQAVVVSLAHREVLSLEGDRRGMRITAGVAPIWITQEGDPEDHLLEPGERFTVDRPGQVVVQGMRRKDR